MAQGSHWMRVKKQVTYMLCFVLKVIYFKIKFRNYPIYIVLLQYDFVRVYCLCCVLYYINCILYIFIHEHYVHLWLYDI